MVPPDEPSGARPAGPVVLRIKLRYDDVATLVLRFASNVGKSGLFLPTKSIQPIGTEVKFELRLANDSPVLVGLGRVKHVRPPDPAKPKAPFGMGIELMRVSREGRELILKMIERRRALGLPDVAIPFPDDGDVARRTDDSQPRADGSGVVREAISRFASEPVVDQVLATAPPASAGPIAVAKSAVDDRSGATAVPVSVATSDVSGSVPVQVRESSGAVPVHALDSSSGRRSVAVLAAEPARARRPRVHEIIAKARETSGATTLVEPGLDEHVDLERALTRARALATGDLDGELSSIREAAAAPIEISIEAASAELARQLGGKPIAKRERSTKWVAPPAVEIRREPVARDAPSPEPAIVTPDNLAARAVAQLATSGAPVMPAFDQTGAVEYSGPALEPGASEPVLGAGEPSDSAPPVEDATPQPSEPAPAPRDRSTALGGAAFKRGRSARKSTRSPVEPTPVTAEPPVIATPPAVADHASRSADETSDAPEATFISPEPAATFVDAERGDEVTVTASETVVSDMSAVGMDRLADAEFPNEELTRIPSGDELTGTRRIDRSSFSNLEEESRRTEPAARPSSPIMIDDNVDPTAFERILEGSQPAMALSESDIEPFQDDEGGNTQAGAHPGGDAFSRGYDNASEHLADQLDRQLAAAEAEADDDFRDLRHDQPMPSQTAYVIGPQTEARFDETPPPEDAGEVNDLDVIAEADANDGDVLAAHAEDDFASRLDLGDDEIANQLDERHYSKRAGKPAFVAPPEYLSSEPARPATPARPLAARHDLDQALAALDVDVDELSLETARKRQPSGGYGRPLPGMPLERAEDTGVTRPRGRTGANATIKSAPDDRPGTGGAPTGRGAETRTGGQPTGRGGNAKGPTTPPPIPAAARKTATTPPPLPVRSPPQRLPTADDGIIIDFDDDE